MQIHSEGVRYLLIFVSTLTHNFEMLCFSSYEKPQQFSAVGAAPHLSNAARNDDDPVFVRGGLGGWMFQMRHRVFSVCEFETF